MGTASHRDFDYRSALRAAIRHLERAERLSEALGYTGAAEHCSWHRVALLELLGARGVGPKQLAGQLSFTPPSAAAAGSLDVTALRDRASRRPRA